MKQTFTFFSFIVVFFPGLFSQGEFFRDSVRIKDCVSSTSFEIHIPMGHTFISSSHNSDQSYFTARSENPEMRARLQVDSVSCDKSVRFFGHSHAQSTYHSSTHIRNGVQTSVSSYTFSTNSSGNDPSKSLWEIKPSNDIPLSLNLHSGPGNVRMDMSGMYVKNLNLVLASTDLILSYNSPNRTVMDKIFIKGGMSKIMLRNINFSRSKNVVIENGMGTTTIILSNKNSEKTQYKVFVGAGTCIIMANHSVPVKLVLKESMLSEVNLPENFSPLSSGIYVNHSYLSHPDDAAIFFVDVGVGKLDFVTMRP